MSNLIDEDISTIQAKYEAQKIAFAPIMFQAARVLRDSGILNLVKKNRRKGITPEEVANDLGISIYGVKVLMEAGMAMDILRLEGGRYYITKCGFFILNDRMTQVNMDFVHDVCYRGMFNLEEAIQTGKPAGLRELGPWKTIYQGLSSLPEKVQKSWFDFDHYHSDYAFPDALPLVFKRNHKKLMDIGGNTGRWAFQCVEYSPEVAVAILDLPGQLDMAEKNIRENGLEKRISTIAIDILDQSRSFPEGYDAIWMSQFLDCFSEDEIVSILKRAYAAMDNSSVLYILETYWDRQSYEAARYCLIGTSLYFTCMANGNSKMYHSKDMLRCLREADLVVEEDIDGVGISHTLFACRKR
ncbi:MAG: Demethylspheroidene O-methyltransferase [Syntrophus sp. PtaB.Bin001]|nr:MAG: Demethylspheroidene O-methyltransferase [Syntrophus sp. PtaB.Bin001]